MEQQQLLTILLSLAGSGAMTAVVTSVLSLPRSARAEISDVRGRLTKCEDDCLETKRLAHQAQREAEQWRRQAEREAEEKDRERLAKERCREEVRHLRTLLEEARGNHDS